MTAATLARTFTDAGVFASEPFTVIDVGCSGGIFTPSLEFLPDLRAVGFDPLATEVDRLNATTPGPGVGFECALVGTPEWTMPNLRASRGVYARSSAANYERVHSFDYTREVFNAGQDVVEATHMTSLETWLDEHPEWRPDLIKIDTDGADLGVLRSLGTRLGDALAIHIEVNFDGDPGPDANTFATVFNTLAGAGYRLFSLVTTNYSKAALPRPFAWNIPAQTVGGQINQGDALFCRDLAVEGSDSHTRLLKLACIFDLFGLTDCSAELLANHHEAVASASPLTPTAIADVLGARTELCMTPDEAHQALESTPGVFFPATNSLPWPGGDFSPLAHGWSQEDDSEVGGNGANDTESRAGDKDPTEPQAADEEPCRLPIGGMLEFKANRGGIRALDQGWWAPESTGTWSSGSVATLTLSLPEGLREGSHITLAGWHLDPGTSARRFALVINGVSLVDVGMGGDEYPFRVPDEIPAGDATVTIHTWPVLTPPNPLDHRALGFHLSAITASGLESA